MNGRLAGGVRGSDSGAIARIAGVRGRVSGVAAAVRSAFGVGHRASRPQVRAAATGQSRSSDPVRPVNHRGQCPHLVQFSGRSSRSCTLQLHFNASSSDHSSRPQRQSAVLAAWPRSRAPLCSPSRDRAPLIPTPTPRSLPLSASFTGQSHRSERLLSGDFNPRDLGLSLAVQDLDVQDLDVPGLDVQDFDVPIWGMYQGWTSRTWTFRIWCPRF